MRESTLRMGAMTRAVAVESEPVTLAPSDSPQPEAGGAKAN
jgi:hypothetical protein